jgi:putative membrane protein
MMYYHPGYMIGFGLLALIAGLIHLLFWLFVIIVIIKLVKRRKNGSWHKMWQDRGAVGILRERFAKGEISKEEFEERKRVLES